MATTTMSVPADDPALPAVVHLTGPDAPAVVGAAVDAAGGRLHEARPCHVQYRPGHDMVVRYRCEVTWPGRGRSTDTILAATTTRGPLPDTVPVVADSDDGPISVSVWRWPHDPVLTGLPTATTPSAVVHPLDGLVTTPVEIEVVAYRPTERAVVRVTDASGTTRYVKVLPPATVSAVAERHSRLATSGLPVPDVERVVTESGLLVMAERAGTTLRDRIKHDLTPWPTPSTLLDLAATLRSVAPDGLDARPTRVGDALGHARLLERVLASTPDGRARDDLAVVVDACSTGLEAARARTGPLVHGDLHEAQLVVDGRGVVTGLLDVDDVGPGDPLDDLAVLLAHLRYRARTDPDRRGPVEAYVARLRSAFGEAVDPAALDLVTAAVLVGLATGPFRVQQQDWPAVVAGVLDDAAALIGR